MATRDYLVGRELLVGLLRGEPDPTDYRAILETHPDPVSLSPMSWAAAELGRLDEASEILERLSVDDFRPVANDLLPPIGALFLSEACAALDDAPRATALIRFLAHHARYLVRVGRRHLGWTCRPSPRCLGTPATGSDVGIAVDGVRIFDGTDALLRDAVAHETQDACGGQPERTGRYHYHSIPSCLTAGESEHTHSGIVGWAFDGFPIAGPRGAHGRLLTNADLDVCHGHTHRLCVDGKLVRTYHYHATLEFPYTVGCFRGVR